jgi:hypothetical protein
LIDEGAYYDYLLCLRIILPGREGFQSEIDWEFRTEVFALLLLQRDGVDSFDPPYNVMTDDESCKAIFALDQDKGLKADVFLLVLDGRVHVERACVALGIMYS